MPDATAEPAMGDDVGSPGVSISVDRPPTSELTKLLIALTGVAALLLAGYVIVNRDEVLGRPRPAVLENSGCGNLGSVSTTVDGTVWLLDPITAWPDAWEEPRPGIDQPARIAGELRARGDRATFTAAVDGMSVELRQRYDSEFFELGCAVS